MTKKKEYPGINIQWPYSELILQGVKTIETRTYPIPEKYIGKEMVLIETPGKQNRFKARIRGLIVFHSCYVYSSEASFYLDIERHHVVRNSDWAWQDKLPKWAWELRVIEIFNPPRHLYKRQGIIYTRDVAV